MKHIEPAGERVGRPAAPEKDFELVIIRGHGNEAPAAALALLTILGFLAGVLLAWLLSSGVSLVLLPMTLLVAFVIALLLARGAGRRRTAGWMMAGGLLLPVALYAGIMVGASGIQPR